jgi:uncharacterized protein
MRYLGSVLIFFLIKTTLISQHVNEIKLSNYNPRSIYNIPATTIARAKYPVIDFHSHDYVRTDAEVDLWVRVMDSCNIARTIILSYQTGDSFDMIYKKYKRYPDRFEIWCGLDYSDYPRSGWQDRTIRELERCHQIGATGIGELGDKGLGEFYSSPVAAPGLHIDDPAFDPILQKCAQLGLPVSIHVAEDAWMYEPADEFNDGLMNAGTWHVNLDIPGIQGHDRLIDGLEAAIKRHPNTIFIACHLANSCADLDRLARIFDRYPNVFAEMAARFGEIAPMPRKAKSFFEKYNSRLLYGTDMGTRKKMYQTTFRILESADEHFYEKEFFDYHWPLHGLDLSDKTLQKIYHTNGKKLLMKIAVIQKSKN